MIKITETDTKIAVKSPYHPDFPRPAKKLGGRWDGASKTWTFDARDSARVKALCREIYGTDGSPDQLQDLVAVRATFPERDSTYDLSCYVAGRQVARAYDRDGGATLGEGTVVLEHGFFSTGSRKNPALGVNAGTVVEVRDIPRPAAARAVEEGGGLGAQVEIVEAADADRADLEAERDLLQTRLAEIEARLAEIEIEVLLSDPAAERARCSIEA